MDSSQTKSDKQKVAELIARLKERFGDDDGLSQEAMAGTLKYVIYVRRSLTKNVQKKQTHSITDQLRECRKLQKEEGLHIVDTIPEKKSAKISDKRPEFRAMLDNMKAGKYDGIIAWSPDRLARNMKEGGEIIDMLDHGDIKDIKFANHFIFSDDSSGKMLLGMAFITAKNFSDTHSQNINRTIYHKTSEGKWAGSKLKQGYYKDKKHYLRPDDENHELICKIFKMRLDGKQLKEIAVFLRGRGFPVTTKHTKHRDLVINEKFVSNILHDKFYFGAMKFGGQYVNLFEKYDFVPAISYDDFERLYKAEGKSIDFELADVFAPHPEKKATLLNGMVICGHCMKPMYPSITTKEKKDGTKTRYYYFDCKHEDCGKKRVRAKVVLQAAYAFLDKHPIGTKAGYTHYVTEMERLSKEKAKETVSELKSLIARKHAIDARVIESKEFLRKEEDEDLRHEFRKDIKTDLVASKELARKIQQLKTSRDSASSTFASLEELVELFQNVAKLIQKIDSMTDLDFILRKLFSNFVIKNGKVTQITQNSPFRELCASENVDDCSLVTPPGIEPGFTG